MPANYPYAPLPGYETPSKMQDIENINVQVNTVEIVGVTPVSGQVPVVDATLDAAITNNVVQTDIAGSSAGVTVQTTCGTGTASQLASHVGREVFLQNSNANGAGSIVYWGFTAGTCYMELAVGQSAVIPVTNSNKLYILGSASSLTVSYAVRS